MTKKSYSFQTETIDFQDIIVKGEKKRFVTGYISTSDLDLYNDVVTEKGLKSMLNQLNDSTIMLDYEHEAWRDDNSIIPVGKIVESKLDDRGLWVKAELNPFSPKFDNMWGSIKKGFIKAFSIAFVPVTTVMKTIEGTEVRLIEELELLNVALTGAPVNPKASMTGFKGLKGVMMKAINDLELEENTMTDKKEIKDEAPAEEVKEEAEVKEEVKEEVKDEAPVEEVKKEEPAEEVEEVKAMKKLTEDMEKMAKELKETKSELKDLSEKPVFKSLTPNAPEVKAEAEVKSVLEAIK